MPDGRSVQDRSEASPYRRALRRLSRTVPVNRVPLLRGQAVALACAFVATGARLALDPVLTGVPYVTFFPAILIASIWGGTRAGLTTLVLGWLVTSAFWLHPSGEPSLDGAVFWKAAAFVVFGGLLLICAGMLRDLVVQLRRSEEHARVLAAEMEHRIENLLATVTALARQTARSTGSVEEHVSAFEARMAALGQARKLALAAPAGAADLDRLMKVVLSPFGLERITLNGSDCLVPDRLSTMLALAFHELATNALKYGALSQLGGRVDIRCSRTPAGMEVIWQESGGPAVAKPTRSGFGTRMIRQSLAAHGASAELDFVPDGLRCRLVFPEAQRPEVTPTRTAGASPLLPAGEASR